MTTTTTTTTMTIQSTAAFASECVTIQYGRTPPPPPSPRLLLLSKRSTSSKSITTTTATSSPSLSQVASATIGRKSATDDDIIQKTDQSTTGSATEDEWKSQLLKASDAASLLCVLDCTLLPIVTMILPLFGLVAASPTQMEYLHELGHSLALWFVVPVGGSAQLLNYWFAHQQNWIATLGVLGLLLVLMANAPHDLLHAIEHAVPSLDPVLHAMHEGIIHRTINITGCFCLLMANYLSKQQQQQQQTQTTSSSGGQCFLEGCFCGPLLSHYYQRRRRRNNSSRRYRKED